MFSATLSKRAPIGGSGPHRLIEDRKEYWYDPRVDRIVVAADPPCSDALEMIANFNPDAPALDLNDLLRIFKAQQSNAFNPKSRTDGGSYNTNDKRVSRASSYSSQLPKGTLQDQHPNVYLKDERNPNGRGGVHKAYSSRDLFFELVVMPDSFKFTTAVVANCAKEGLLHSLIRHGNQFCHLPNNDLVLKDILDVIPSHLRPAVKALREVNDKLGNKKLNKNLRMKEVTDDDYEDLLKLLGEFHVFIQRIVQSKNYRGERVNTNGQVQIFWDINGSDYLVLAVSEQLWNGKLEYDTTRPPRPIKTIITIFVTSAQNVEKIRESWPVTMQYK